MKPTLLFVLTFSTILFVTQSANAKIWRVNNNGYSADFTSLQLANNDNRVTGGDTIHLEGSATAYVGTSISKKLIIIGPGYFLSENQNTSSNALSALVNYINFNNGAQGSQLIGTHIGGSSLGISINTSNITIKRCRIDYSIGLINGIADIRILQNFFSNFSTGSNIISTTSLGFPSDVVVNNNIIQRVFLLPEGYTLLECKNNVFDSPAISSGPSIQVAAGFFQNNIVTNPSVTVDINNGATANVSYNISTSASNQFGTSNNNIVVPAIASLFVDAASNTTDGDYQLKPGSPGSNNGSDGTDRGAFGGLSAANRYTLSGLPPVPVIYEVVTPAVTGPAGLQVTIKARTIK